MDSQHELSSRQHTAEKSRTQPQTGDQEADVRNDLNIQDTARDQTDDAEIVGSPVESMPALCVGVDARTDKPIDWPLTVQGNPHLLISGLPGMGKTALLLHLCRQMDAAGVWPIVFSYHQDIDGGLAQFGGAVCFIDAEGLGFNPLQVRSRTAASAHLDVAGTIGDIFMAIYPELGDLQGEQIRSALKSSLLELGWGNRDVDSVNSGRARIQVFCRDAAERAQDQFRSALSPCETLGLWLL